MRLIAGILKSMLFFFRCFQVRRGLEIKIFFLSNESKPNFMVVRGMIDEEN